MRYEFTVGRSCRVKTFLKEHDISNGLLAKIKFEGGHIWVNGEEQFATYPVHEGDVVVIDDNFGIRITEIVKKPGLMDSIKK